MENESKFLLDRELFEDLKAYLEDKRSALRDTLLFSISFERGGRGPYLEAPVYESDSFEYALSEFDKRSDILTREDLEHFDHETLIDRFSNILWNYVEILEGMCRELFEQLKSLPVDLWDNELFDRLESAKVFLWGKLKEIDNFIKHLNVSLKFFILKCLRARKFTFLDRVRAYLKSPLDLELNKRVKKAELYLHHEFQHFAKDFAFLKKTEARIETEQYKFEGYSILNQLEYDKQRLYRRLWRLTKLWKAAKINQKNLLPRFAKTIRHVCPCGRVSLLAKDYLKQMKDNVFEFARGNRLNRDLGAQAVISMWRGEIFTLKVMLESYRNFLTETDTHHKAASFLPWKQFQDTRKSKDLQLQIEQAVLIDKWLADLFDAQERIVDKDVQEERVRFRKIDRLLQDMSQPLISRSVMKSRSGELIKELSEADELVSTLPEVSELMLNVLLRAFKADKYETLTEADGFWNLWEIHHGLTYTHPSLNHTRRMKDYTRVVQHLKHWIAQHQLSTHIHDTEHDIHDIQEGLQEFYHSIKDDMLPVKKWELKKELLEERVFFSSFFSYLRKEKEGKWLRAEFSFVDTYFESISQKLNEVIVQSESSDSESYDHEEE